MNEKDYDFAGLVKKCKEIREKVQYRDLFENGYDRFYLSAKDIPFVGYFQGYFAQVQRKKHKIKESDKLRSNCKNYLEIYRDDTELIQIVNYCKGRIDCIHQCYHVDDKTYLIPFSREGGFYPTYTYVDVYDGLELIEEYAISGNQIIFDKYKRMDENQMEFARINYVVGGKVPILEERRGIIIVETLDYKETYYDDWLNHR